MKKTAKSEYARIKTESKTLLKLIGEELKDHNREAKEDGPHWGHVGDLGHIKELMIELLTFARNAEDENKMLEQIEQELKSANKELENE